MAAAPCGLLLVLLLLAKIATSEDSLDAIKTLRDEAVARLNQLGKTSDSKEFLERTFLSPAAIRAGKLVQEWMQDAGLDTWMDDIGNIHGRADGANASAPALLMGSHLDTVIDAGKYDGALGIVSAIAAVKMLNSNGKLRSYVRPIEIIAFCDEEGVRFQSTFLGSAAVAGVLRPDILSIRDRSGVTLETSLKTRSFKGTRDSLVQLRYSPESVWGYVEVHIEQGPVLEARGIPLGLVEAIAGQTRLKVRLHGAQGHAGTVPMAMRKDPMPGAAQAIVSVEKLCRDSPTLARVPGGGRLVCTVGEIFSWPGASNVIPGEVAFTIDLRATDDSLREEIVGEVEESIRSICRGRGLSCTIDKMHEAKAVGCDKDLMASLKAAAESTVLEVPGGGGVDAPAADDLVPSLMSGAGHDAMAMSHLTKIGMLFVRCKGGISHSPAESVSDDDVLASSLSLLHFLNNHLEHEQPAPI
ncbi:allantoate deiminase 2 isoform X1 [Selaginella moellendorffii]|uniref:allantoate deiminase 2 isoform X1 n=1 Tax=Selaginella moellendorffii TaxID=88036 RepID=UPI000D1CA3D8|nr:allantoate deiminase 2 isoform X1 [Selaginella moellendorffii]|eukprot:XP_024530115.1 allantoate deiminase 2 isoform X1 [Selaginella moellendorffii]